MSEKLKKLAYNFLVLPVGNMLVLLQPEKARQLSENRITLVHKPKRDMSLSDRVMRSSLLHKLDKIQDYSAIAEQNRNFWVNSKATELFSDLEDTFKTDFIPHCTFIFDLLKKELSETSVEFNTLVEIGTGNGDVLNYLSAEFPNISRFVGIDLSPDQIELNKDRFSNNEKLEFVAADAFDWVKENGHGNTVFVTSRGVLEYFLQPRLQELFNMINGLGKTIFIAIEPNGADHDFDAHPETQLYGHEPSFSHNYPLLFKNAGFDIWHFSQKVWYKASDMQTFVGAKN